MYLKKSIFQNELKITDFFISNRKNILNTTVDRLWFLSGDKNNVES